MKKGMLILMCSMLMLATQSCTENKRAKSYGGEATITLEKGKKLVTATWKGSSLWYLTREMKPGESAETYKFHEESSFGIWEGTYIIIEVEKEEVAEIEKWVTD